MALESFATGDDFLTRYDARLIGDLVRDDSTQEDDASLPQNPVLLAMLDDAFGEIVSAIVKGNRYTLAQLDSANLAPSAIAMLRRLQCDLTLVLIKRRRGKFSKENDGSLDEENKKRLKEIQDGEFVLLPVTVDHAPAATIGMAQPELIPLASRNTIRTRTRNYYPNYPYDGTGRPYTNGGN